MHLGKAFIKDVEIRGKDLQEMHFKDAFFSKLDASKKNLVECNLLN